VTHQDDNSKKHTIINLEDRISELELKLS